MLDRETVYFTVDEYFNSFGLKRINDEKLKNTDCYYIDPKEEKYIFVCKVFTEKSQLIMDWESSQDEDIALYLQQKKYANNDIRWDMYFVIIYIGDDQFNIEEFHAIEKDKFCCKKLVLKAKCVNELFKEFNTKLPFTKDYFKLGDKKEVFTDSGFLTSLNDKSGMKDDVLSLHLLRNLTEEKDELLRRLLKHELDSIGERK
jgi:hypothetical protein